MKIEIGRLSESLSRGLRVWRDELGTTLSWWVWNIPYHFISILIGVLIYYYYAQAFGGRSSLFGDNFIAYIIMGLMVNAFLDVSMSAYYHAITALYSGRVGIGGLALSRIDYFYLANISPYYFISARVAYQYITQAIIAALYLVVGAFFFKFSISLGANLWLALLLLVLGVLACSGIGLISASMYWIADVYVGVEPIVWSIRVLVPLVSGVYVPLKVLPPWVKSISLLLPQTYVISGVRRVLLSNVSLQEVLPNIITLIIFSVILIPTGIMMLKYSLYLAKKRGTIL